MTEVPTITVGGLNDSDKRAVVIADNRLPEQAVWDFDLLRGHFQDLIKLDFDVELTGFSTGEVDLLIDGSQQPPAADPADVKGQRCPSLVTFGSSAGIAWSVVIPSAARPTNDCYGASSLR